MEVTSEKKIYDVFYKSNEVQLVNPPLVNALAQIKFETILNVQKNDFLASFQNKIRSVYPLVKRAVNQTHTFDAMASAVSVEERMTWKFFDEKENWIVSVSPDFLAIQTKSYDSRKDFNQRLEFVLKSFSDLAQPKQCQRIGVRYVNLLTDKAFDNVPTFINPKLHGIFDSDLRSCLDASVSEALFNIKNHHLFTRWGFLPPGSTTDIAVLKPVNKDSWVLDIDTYNTEKHDWNVGKIMNDLNELETIGYNYFKWAVTPDFLKNYGGKL